MLGKKNRPRCRDQTGVKEEIAKRTTGVRSVVNSIQIDSGFGRSVEIADDVRRRITRSRYIRPTNLEVEVTGGIVTLTGGVATRAQSQQAQMVALEVHGVRAVRNNLRVTELPAAAGRNDDALRSDIEAKLARDAYLVDLPIRVFVDDGAVRLEGEVPNLFHREHASEE